MVGKRRWGFSIILAACSACSSTAVGDQDPPPNVEDVAPRQGEYGTTVTVRGQYLQRSAVTGRSPDGELVPLAVVRPSATEDAGSKARPGADAGTEELPFDAPLAFRFAFPAEGEMTLTGPHPDLPLGSFTPSWTPGQPARLEGQKVLGVAMLGADAVVLVDGPRGAAFMVFGAGAPREVAVAPAVRDVKSAALRVSGGNVEALLETNGSALSLLTFDGANAVSAAYEATGGRLLGIGVDDLGFVAVTLTGDAKIARLRGAPPVLAAVGEAVPVPASIAAKKGVLAVSGDGTVVHAWSGDGGNFLDDMASFSMAGLPAGADAFTSARHVASLDDTFKSIAAEVHGGVVKISYCAVDSGVFETTKTVCSASTTVDGASSLSLEGQTARGDGPTTFAAGRLTYASCEKDDVMFVHSSVAGAPSGAGEPSIYPCSTARVHAVATGEAGTRIVVEQQGKLWVARRRGG